MKGCTKPYVPFDDVASLPFARKCPARSSVSQRGRDYQRHLEMALECVIVQLSKGQLSQDQARDIGWGLRELLLRIKKGLFRLCHSNMRLHPIGQTGASFPGLV